MRCVKTVTPRKTEANRRNAKRSTGPRTKRGKSITRFNAVTLGLFAKHVVIPICDGYKPEKEFQLLLNGLHQEFQPTGFYEEWLVVKIAECMWRLRRATRCESGSVREETIWRDRRRDNQHWLELASEIGVLTQAEEQLRNSGTLSQKIYEQVAPLVEKENRKAIQSQREDKWVETDFDHQRFLACVIERKEFLDAMSKSISHIEEQESDARFDYNALLPEEDMDRVLRYEERMHRQIDWSVQRLLEAQERRKTVQFSSEHGALPAGEHGKRSQ